MAREPIRLRLTARKSEAYSEDPREAFWRSTGGLDVADSISIDELEAKIKRKFGDALRQELIRHLRQPLDNLIESRDRNFERLFFRFYDRPRFEKGIDQSPFFDSVARVFEQDQEEIRNNIAAQSARRKIALTSSVIFDLRIVGYSSLSLDMFVSSLDKLTEIFDNDFDSFCVFLNAFCPAAYAEVFSDQEADQINFSVKVPDSYRSEFSKSITGQMGSASASKDPGASDVTKAAKARDRAEWLWRIANGSLLVPVVLALIVMYEGMSILRGIESMQYGAIKPVLDLQLNLLEEDRMRLLKGMPVESTTSTTATSPATP